ncbi:uncharacterized protein KIAA0930-like [Liolophura sinensis]|uniref:uncharacterized protein KIAA0930-like n=1 Tax=Liolophura sinensis TaxID=3198878 RepID=UPI0031587D9E
MLSSIAAERSREQSGSNNEKVDGFEVLSVSSFWTDLFSRHFLEREDGKDDSRDDMLFYVKKIENGKGKGHLVDIEVYRRQDAKKPELTDSTVNWEETVYLNIILHQFEYTATVAICTRTSLKELQILKKFTQRVYPSPSKRRMDSKGTEEEMAYPNIYFAVDNFEEIFSEIIVRDSEMVCVELVASDRDGTLQGVLFLGSIRYEALRNVYDARASLTSRLAQNMSLGWFKGHKRVEFMRMRGPHGKGHAEMAVSRVKGSGPETPDLENFPVEDFDDQNQYSSRRMSDPSNSIGSYVRGGFRRALSMKKSRSETENVEGITSNGCTEVEANTIHEELAYGEHYDGFIGKSFGQAWHWFKERRRAGSVALHSYLTYVTLPWHRIIADVLEVKQQPVLDFKPHS